MSETPFNYQNQPPQRYNLMNGVPSENKTGILPTKAMPAYNNAIFQNQKPPASVNSNGMSTSSSLHSSRDSSPLPPPMKHNNFEYTPQNPPTKNILLSQPQENSQNILLAASKFQNPTPSLVTNNQFNTLIAPANNIESSSPRKTSHQNNNVLSESETVPQTFTTAATTLPQRQPYFSNSLASNQPQRASPIQLRTNPQGDMRSPLQSPPAQTENKSGIFMPPTSIGNNFQFAPISQPNDNPSTNFPQIPNQTFNTKPGDFTQPKFITPTSNIPQKPPNMPPFQNQVANPPNPTRAHNIPPIPSKAPNIPPPQPGNFNLNPMSSQPGLPPQNMFPSNQPPPMNYPPTSTAPLQGPPVGISRKYPTQNAYQQPLMQQPPMQQPPMPQPHMTQPPMPQPPMQQPMQQPMHQPMHQQMQQSQQYGGYNQPPQPQYSQQNQYQQGLNQQFNNLNVTQTGFNRLWGGENVDLLVCRNVLPFQKVEAPQIHLQPAELNEANCAPDIFRCTVTRIPDTSALLNKSRLPLGVLIHPFKDLNHLPVIQCSTIVRCRACRTYINPFVYFVDQKRWKCNLCYRVNELPEEFQFDPVTKSYGDPSRRPEVKTSTIEYIAPSEYMIRPPQPAVYLFLLDVSSLAIESGYLRIMCDTLIQNLDALPGDARTQIGFICYNSSLHFYSLADGLSQPHEMTVIDVDDVFLPSPDNLLVKLKHRKELVKDLLHQLPSRFQHSHDSGSALGAALQAAFKMMTSTGGRVSVFQCTLPTVGPGSLVSREVPSNRASDDVQHLNPATDFYKRLALECSGHQIAVDLFILNSQYIDLSTISGISRFSAGCIHHWPLFKSTRIAEAQQFENCLKRYFTRKIGYEAVMRIRCTRGLAIHTFHGNFFVRSTDLLTLPNCNPDSGFGMQVSIEESLSDLQTVCFQAALLYTSSKGERRIRVHTLCLPIAHTLPEVLNSADQQCIVGLVAKMAVDRSLQSNLADARDAFINVVVDVLSAYKLSLNQGSVTSNLLAPESLKLLPLYIVALLKHVAFRTGTSTRLDDRVYAMCQMKTLPLANLIQEIYPDLYPIHGLTDENGLPTESGRLVPQPPRLQLTAEKLDSRGAFLLDCNNCIYIYVGHAVSVDFVNNSLGFEHFNAIPDDCLELPKVDTEENDRLHLFISTLNDNKPYPATIQILRDNSPFKRNFLDKLIEDRIETALSYYEFLQHLKSHVK